MPRNEKDKKDYTVNDLLDEFFPESSDKSEEISAEDVSDDDTVVSADMLEYDRSEALNADISVADKSEWETVLPKGNDAGKSETFDGNSLDGGNDKAPENGEDKASQDKSGNKEMSAEMNEGTEFSKAETDGNDTGNGNISEISDENDVNQKFILRFLKAIFPWKGDGVGEVIRKIIFLIAVIVFVGAGIMLISTLTQSQEAIDDKEDVQSVITTTVATTVDTNGNVVTIAPTKEEIADHNLNVAEHFKNINEDYIGYLELGGCDIYEPVMQGDDNDYYLTHNYYGGLNKAGTLFMDHRCTYSKDYVSPNIVIYGHNQEDGTMFGNLKRYKQNVDFYAENPVVKFSFEDETEEYLIYAFFVTNALEKQDRNGEVFHYHDYIETLGDEATFNWYMDMVKERNQIVSPVDVQFGDKLLCLSTCSNEFSNSRFVVFARKLREGESVSDYDLSKTYLNPYARGVDWEAIMSGETSETSEETSEITTTEDFEIKVFVEDAFETTVPEETKKTSKTSKKPKVTERTLRTEETIKKRPITQKKTETTTETESVVWETIVSGEDGISVETMPPESSDGETSTVTAS